jgi:hypothetical protein
MASSAAGGGDDDGDDGSGSRALTRPRAMIADSLDRAEPGQLVYAGRDGTIIPAARARRRSAAVIGLAGASFALGVGVSIAYVPVMLIPYALIGARAGATFRAARALNRVAVLMQDDQIAEARRIAEPIATRWWVPRMWRGLALYRLAWCAVYERDFERALALIRQARPRLSPRMIHAHVARYGEIQVLVSLGRTDEARALLAEIGTIPDGELLRVAHWETELYVAFASKRHDLDDDALHARVRKALAMNRSRLFLILLAWAHEASGDLDQMGFLLTQAEDRRTPRDRIPPLVETWLSSHPAPPPDDD